MSTSMATGSSGARPAAHAKKRLILCADDYAFTPGISRSMRELLSARRISAVSVMAASQYWPAEAPSLKDVAGDADIGLHVTLTDHTPLGAMPGFAPGGKFPPMGAVMKAGLMRRLPVEEIRGEVERQLASFVRHYGRPPSHIDGHHHVQQLPGVRDIVVEVARRVGAGRIWVRSGSVPAGLARRRGVATGKAMIIGALGGGISRRARTAGVPVNQGFSGAYDFATETRPMGELFERFVLGAAENALVMCHPGYADAALKGLDPVTHTRDAEHAYLMSDAWPALLAREELELGPYRHGGV